MSKHPIYLYRMVKGISLDELGDLLSVGRSYLSRVERGLRKVPVDRAMEWERRTGISWESIVSWDIDRKENRKHGIRIRPEKPDK